MHYVRCRAVADINICMQQLASKCFAGMCTPVWLGIRPCSCNLLRLQIKLLRILGLLGAADKAASDNMYAVIADSMRRANTGHTIGNAIVYEAVRAITAIYPNPALLQSGLSPKPQLRECFT